MKVSADVIFRGRVQGVHFRDYTRRFARRKGVNGWVRNLADGTVEAIFEGEKENIEEVIRLLRDDQPFARVDRVDLTWSDFQNRFEKFDIR
jgi:acylphosphatase